MCNLTTSTTIYTVPSSILPSIVSFSIPNAPIMSSATMFLSLLPPPQKSLLCQLVVVLMPPPLILLTLPPPSASKHATLAYQGPVASCPLVPLLPFASRMPAGCRIACCCVSPPRVTFRRTAAACVHPRPLLFVCASWLSRRISSLRLLLSTRRRLTTGCVVAVADAQA